MKEKDIEQLLTHLTKGMGELSKKVYKMEKIERSRLARIESQVELLIDAQKNLNKKPVKERTNEELEIQVFKYLKHRWSAHENSGLHRCLMPHEWTRIKDAMELKEKEQLEYFDRQRDNVGK